MDSVQPLTSPAFYVLLALHHTERHGYAIMKEVGQASNGVIKLGPGTLYGLMKRLLAEGLVEAWDERPDPELDDERRRYYRITEAGRRRLGLELQRFEQAVETARTLGINYRSLVVI